MQVMFVLQNNSTQTIFPWDWTVHQVTYTAAKAFNKLQQSGILKQFTSACQVCCDCVKHTSVRAAQNAVFLHVYFPVNIMKNSIDSYL